MQLPHTGYPTRVSDEKHNTQGIPNGERQTEADTASGGAPEESGEGQTGQQSSKVDPDSGTDENGEPVENPSGG